MHGVKREVELSICWNQFAKLTCVIVGSILYAVLIEYNNCCNRECVDIQSVGMFLGDTGL